MSTADDYLIKLLNSLRKGCSIGKKEIEMLLELSDPEDMGLLFKAARDVRKIHFDNQIFLYGFLYFSTHCRNNCRFCRYRSANTSFPRYRKTHEEIVTAAGEMAGAGVHLIDLTMGEDPLFYVDPDSGFDPLIQMVKAVQDTTRLPVMISFGALPDPVLEELAKAGAVWYAGYQETHNKQLYETLRMGQDFDERLLKKCRAKDLGMLIEEGILTGVGESLSDLSHSILSMKYQSVDQARVMTFVPQPGTPMADIGPQNSAMEQKIIAVMRLVLQDVLIPASLDVDGLSGLKARLDAGANVVTSIVPAQNGLAGVANQSKDIETSRRTLAHILPVLETCKLEPALPEAYLAWTIKRKNTLRRSAKIKEKQVC